MKTAICPLYAPPVSQVLDFLGRLVGFEMSHVWNLLAFHGLSLPEYALFLSNGQRNALYLPPKAACSGGPKCDEQLNNLVHKFVAEFGFYLAFTRRRIRNIVMVSSAQSCAQGEHHEEDLNRIPDRSLLARGRAICQRPPAQPWNQQEYRAHLWTSRIGNSMPTLLPRSERTLIIFANLGVHHIDCVEHP